MSNLTKVGAAAVLALSLLAVAGTPSLAVRIRTPNPKQATFFEQLQKGERPSLGKQPTAAQKAKLSAAPATNALVASQAAVAPVATTFYFSAHPDDYALFMYPYRDVILPDARVVFVFMTAGDGGFGAGPSGASYYLARENGAQRGVRFMADAENEAVAAPSTTRVTVNGHSIVRTAYKNTVTYFLRLPDGNGDGLGFAGTGNASLARLRNRQISTLRAVDGSTTYTSWADLVSTLTTIVRTQAVGTQNVWLNTHDPNTSANPGDHSDHWTTGFAAAAIQPALPCVNMAYHTGYATSGLVNMDIADIANKTGTFANYASGMAERSYPGRAFDDLHKSWIGALVYRIVGGNWQGCRF